MYRIATLTTALFLITVPSLAQNARFESLGDLPGGVFGSQAEGMSADGTVVVGASSSENGSEAFRWEAGVMEGLGDLPGGPFTSIAQAISSDGSVIVGYGTVENDALEGFRWENGEMEGLGWLPPEGFYSVAWAVSDDGSVIAGAANNLVRTDTTTIHTLEGARWENGVMEGLGWLPDGDVYDSNASAMSADGSILFGTSASGNAESGYEVFRWEDGVMEGLGNFSNNTLINDATPNGSVVIGYDISTSFTAAAIRWEDGEYVDLGRLPNSDELLASARAVSANGSVIVGTDMVDGSYTSFIWTEEDGMRDLKRVLEGYGLDLTGWTLTTPTGISDDGNVIAGYGTNPDGNTEAWRAEAPFTVADEATPKALADVLSAPSPNPVHETSTFTIAVEHGQNVSVEVFDALGRHVQTVYDGTLAADMSETLTLDASALPAGVYVIRATGEDFTKSRRVTVVR